MAVLNSSVLISCGPVIKNGLCRSIATSSLHNVAWYKLVIVGGGSAGTAMAAKFAKELGENKVAVIEPRNSHYYQPMWTLVGGGVKTLSQSKKAMKNVLPQKVKWLKTSVVQFDPEKSKVITKDEDIAYDYLIVATGLQVNFDKVKGLKDALNTPYVSSIYSPETVIKTYPSLQNFKNGNAIFTFPNSPVKCPGAPQKIMYLAEDYFRKNNVRDQTNVIYNTALPVIFGVKKYAKSLSEIVAKRNIKVNHRLNLIEVNSEKKEAIFEELDNPGATRSFSYNLLHVTPPMGPIEVVKQSPLVDAAGWVSVNKETLQHTVYKNVFAIGDCSNVPTSKTAAAVAAQSGVLYKNLLSVMNGASLDSHYDGYTSCPLVTGYGKCILAEFDFNGQPLETFPIDQGKESRIAYVLKKDFMPFLYWQLFLNGYWNGPKKFRKIFHLSFGMNISLGKKKIS